MNVNIFDIPEMEDLMKPKDAANGNKVIIGTINKYEKLNK